MAGELVPDVLMKIMIGFDIKDLIRFKSVCKSWYSFICGTRFVRAHLDYSYNIDRNNNNIEHRRVIRDWLPFGVTPFLYENGSYLVGSSNGLVCVSPSHAHVFVANPETREVNILPNPQLPDFVNTSLCWGFGYDLSIDDYKVIVGFDKGVDRTCFQVLTLKSNIWRLIGEVNYTCFNMINGVGILCNEALHWIMKDQNKKKVILSFQLSQEEFREIPEPDDEDLLCESSLGIIKDCLCIFKRPIDVWMMKKYNEKQSWDFMGHDTWVDIKTEVIHCLSELTHDNIPYERSLCHDIWYCRGTWDFIGAPIYVQSLVSPHVQRGQKRKQRLENNNTVLKLIKGDPSVPGPSTRV